MRLQLFSNYCLSPITNNIILLDLSCPLQMVYYIIYLNIFYIRTVWNSKQGIYRVILRNCQEVTDNCSTQGIEHVTKYFIKQAIVSNFKTISSGGAQIQVGRTQRGGLTSQGYCALFFDMIFLPAIQGILCSTCDRTYISCARKKYSFLGRNTEISLLVIRGILQLIFFPAKKVFFLQQESYSLHFL